MEDVRREMHYEGWIRKPARRCGWPTPVSRCIAPIIPLLHSSVFFSVPYPHFTLADDLPAAGAGLKVLLLSQALAAVFVLRLDLLATDCTMVDDECIHLLDPPLAKRYRTNTKHARISHVHSSESFQMLRSRKLVSHLYRTCSSRLVQTLRFVSLFRRHFYHRWQLLDIGKRQSYI